ncbi:hypothetical protein [Acinetobacter bereziniae]|uniref:hypothetical protein n=1 Tax=Acinetobacter bereziniae TaxID=106648 RepID=UPI00190031F4|nr:hypothetical protein [Acinetobacter bereziniae]MBJ8475366.1 hypothetical protein [Acinetobacter bereziniae]
MQHDSNVQTAEAEISKYHCKCGGLIFPDFESYKIGDEVNFIQQTTEDIGKGLFSITQKALTGIITKIKGNDIQVKSKNKLYDLYRFGITPKDAPGPIEYRRIGKCRCDLDKEASQ